MSLMAEKSIAVSNNCKIVYCWRQCIFFLSDNIDPRPIKKKVVKIKNYNTFIIKIYQGTGNIKKPILVKDPFVANVERIRRSFIVVR